MVPVSWVGDPFCSPLLAAYIKVLTKESSTARLHSLDLGQVDRGSAEAGRELGDIKEDALGGSYRAQLGAGCSTEANLGDADRLLKRTVLLGVVAVGAESAMAGGRGGKAIGQLA